MSQKFHDHFSAVSNRYADFRPHYPAELFDFLTTLAPASATVWDCAAGNGQASHDLAARFAKVIATDASRHQIASATPNAKIDFRVATAEESGMAAQSVELVTVAQALHWFNFDKFYAEVRRVLQPGGVLIAWAYGINEVEGAAANEVALDYYSNVVGPYWPPERRLVEEGYRTIPFPFQEIASPSFKMETFWTLEQLLGYFSTWSATNRYIKANGRNPLAELRDKLCRVWPEADSPRRIYWPLSVRIGRV
jgi:ubiquinone/menaquinone biosynthesis C-methylase UbiE